MKRKIMQATVIRLDKNGIPPSVKPNSFWLMNKQETGWLSHGYPYPTLRVLLDEWDIELGAFGEDAHGVFIEARPSTGPGLNELINSLAQPPSYMKPEQPPIELGAMKQVHNDLSFANKLSKRYQDAPKIVHKNASFKHEPKYELVIIDGKPHTQPIV